METITDKMVEIARFSRVEDAQAMLALLQSEGVDCYLRNEYTTQVNGIIDMGGVRVEMLEESVPKAMQILKDNGYDIPEEDENPDDVTSVTSWTSRIPILRKFSLGGQILILVFVIAACLALLIFLGYILT